jgi:hypothetical protein
VVCEGVDYIRSSESQGVLADGTEFGGGDGVAAGVESDIVPLMDQLFGEIRYDSLGASIELWRHTFV